ncbi:hypothetical protein TNCV_996561 [Trichonephila clavipes]|nr:hypothetical protein TNCV_996561 [Trichonephila clavipes]
MVSWLQKDGETCHTSQDSMKILTGFFNDLIISKELWPPCSQELSIPGLFLWEHLKIVTFRYNPPMLDDFKSNIHHAISEIKSHTLRKGSINLGKVTHSSVPNSLYMFLALTSGLLALKLPETRGLDLPDTLKEGENLGK